jgi:hypothetical protein
MPRGFKRSIVETMARRFEDDRSFISQYKIIVNGCPNRNHLVLYGREDKAPIRAEIFRRNRELWNGVNRCMQCRKQTWEDSGEWDHIENKPGKRCDCPENGQVLCSGCHKKKHVHVMSGKVSA